MGIYPHKLINIEVKPNAQSIHSRPYSVPNAHETVFLKELKHLIKIGVLRLFGATRWGSPTFIIPKEYSRVIWVFDFRQSNKVIRRRIYSFPQIHDILNRRPGYEYFTKLDLSMCYYIFELND